MTSAAQAPFFVVDGAGEFGKGFDAGLKLGDFLEGLDRLAQLLARQFYDLALVAGGEVLGIFLNGVERLDEFLRLRSRKKVAQVPPRQAGAVFAMAVFFRHCFPFLKRAGSSKRVYSARSGKHTTPYQGFPFLQND